MKCKECGCNEFIHKNSYYEEIWGTCTEVEYTLTCKECGAYNGHFAYGQWEVDEDEVNNE